MSDISAVELIDSLNRLQQALVNFSQHLNSSSQPFWLPGPNATNLSQAASLYTDIWYRDGQDGRTTVSQHGLIGGTAALIDATVQLNRAKAEFQTLAIHYRLSQSTDTLEALQHRSKKIADLLHRHGAARIHLKQCYRQIPVLRRCPSKIGFSWYTSGRSIRKLTPQEAEQKLLQMDISQPHIQQQLQAVGNLRPDDRLAQIQTQVPVMRANISWKDQHSTLRKAQNTSLPIIIAMDSENPHLPAYNEPPLTPPEARSRLKRSDLKIDPHAFLPSLRAHRYLG
ncbi:DNA replication terminus site-binding protein [Amphritea sp. 1_MG-2023]|uniref:DNA replication terminus site-binding protein n=1 Tax=Amphritea sp. 1_MG-2023 TaxID=3062670 RepID=UPI0026E3277A|nr:DNA replication terminus site-binding protein [Amphritea sp. 1_MG-2023]MDO6562491.1 DNA replication terminus site-binding protein [Amphritea sp. 1_MG-2023]